jgi:Arc/MetJ-type ribon-helix-helix transcriptional regulator
MAKKKPYIDRNKTTKSITIRLKNEEIEAIDAIVEFSEFNSRNECVRHLLQPAFAKFVTAINTKSAWKASVAQISAEMDLNKRLKLARVNSNKNRQLEIPSVEELDVQIVPA